MFLITAYYFAGSVIIYIMCTEYRFVIIRAERIELFQVGMKFRGNVAEIYFGIDVYHRTGLFG